MRNTQPLTKQQQSILTLIYRFRFISTKHVQQALGIKHIGNVQPRLNLLVERGLIGRNYDGSLRLAGLPASYYLLPDGMAALKQFDPDVSKSVLHNMYKDKDAQERFVRRALMVGDINVELELLYRDRLDFFTKSELYHYDDFPEHRPDAYFRIDKGNQEKQYFLEICPEATPNFLHKKRIQEYIEYAEEGEWEAATGTKLPTVLLVCEADSLRRRLQHYAAVELDNSIEDGLDFKVRTLGTPLLSGNVAYKFIPKR